MNAKCHRARSKMLFLTARAPLPEIAKPVSSVRAPALPGQRRKLRHSATSDGFRRRRTLPSVTIVAALSVAGILGASGGGRSSSQEVQLCAPERSVTSSQTLACANWRTRCTMQTLPRKKTSAHLATFLNCLEKYFLGSHSSRFVLAKVSFIWRVGTLI